MSRIADVDTIAVRALLANVNLTKGGLAINAASAATIKTASALTYTVGGIFYTKTALAAQALVPIASKAFYVQPASTTAYYSIAIDNAGNVFTVQGDYKGRPSPTGLGGVGDGMVPDIPEGYAPVGMIKITTNGATTFTPGTTALDAAGLTVSFYDLCLLPQNLQP